MVQRLKTSRAQLQSKPSEAAALPEPLQPCVAWLRSVGEWLPFAASFPKQEPILLAQRELNDLNSQISAYRRREIKWSHDEKQEFTELLSQRDTARGQWQTLAREFCDRLDNALELPAEVASQAAVRAGLPKRPMPPARMRLSIARHRVDHLLARVSAWPSNTRELVEAKAMVGCEQLALQDVGQDLQQTLGLLKKWHQLRATAAAHTNQQAERFFPQLQALATRACGSNAAEELKDPSPQELATHFIQAVHAEEALRGQGHMKRFPQDAVLGTTLYLRGMLQRLQRQLTDVLNLRRSLDVSLHSNQQALGLDREVPKAHKDFNSSKRKIEKKIHLLHAGMGSESDSEVDEDAVLECKLRLRQLGSEFHREWTRQMGCVYRHRPELLLRGWCATQSWAALPPDKRAKAKKKQRPDQAHLVPLQSWVEDMLSYLGSSGLEQPHLSMENFEDLGVISDSTTRHEVRKARTVDQEEVVLKRYGITPQQLSTLRKETRLLQRMSGHPYITEIKYTFMTREAYFVVMPFYRAGTLTEWLEQSHSMEEKRVVMKQLLLALEQVHVSNVVHCDVKPDNIFFQSTTPPHVRLGDFDVSLDNKTRATLTSTVTQRGGFTPLYAAPELLSPNASASPASDVYSLGLLCLEMFFEKVKWESGKPVRLPRPNAFRSNPQLGQLLTVLQQWLHKDPQRRPTVLDILSHPFFSASSLEQEKALDAKDKELDAQKDQIRNMGDILTTVNEELSGLEDEKRRLRGPPRECCVCFEECFLSEGTECAAADAQHFMCRECFSLHVTDQSTQDLDRRRARLGEILCPYRTPQLGCQAQPFACEVIAQRAEPEALRAYLNSQKELKEQELAASMEQEKKVAIREELARLAKMSAFERDVVAARQHAENLLNLKCPRCQAVFLDFNGCFALTCNSCACGFCAWCLEDCGGDAHQHVARCQHNLAPNRSVFSTMELFERAHRLRRERELRAYFQSLGSQELRQAVQAALFHTLEELGLLHLAR